MSGPKCYRYTVDRARLQRQLETERRQRELQQHQQAIKQSRAEVQTLVQVLADLQQRYPAEHLTIDLTPPAPPDENTVEAVQRCREILSRHLAQARADVRRLGERAAANSTVRQLLAELTPESPATVRTATEPCLSKAAWRISGNRIGATTTCGCGSSPTLAISISTWCGSATMAAPPSRTNRSNATARWRKAGAPRMRSCCDACGNMALPTSKPALSLLVKCRYKPSSRARNSLAGSGVARRVCTDSGERLERRG